MSDIKTVIIADMFIPLFFVIIQFIGSGWSRKDAIKPNISANLIQFVGYVVILFSLNFQIYWLENLAIIFIFASSAFILFTTFSLFKVKLCIRCISGWVIVSTILAILTSVFIQNFYVNMFISSIGMGLFFLLATLHLSIRTRKKDSTLLKVFVTEFLLVSICFFVRFVLVILYRDSSSTTWLTSIYIIGASILMLLWNYTVQLKRSSLYKYEIESSVDRMYKIQEDLSILNHIYYEKSITCSLTDLYSNIFDLICDRFAIESIILFLKEEDSFVPAYYRGVTLKEIHTLLNLDKSESTKDLAFSEQKVVDIYVGDLIDGDFKDILLSRGFLGAVSFPLCARGNTIGAISLGITPASTVINRDREIFLSICRQIAGVIYSAKIHNELLESQRELKKLATTDHLTGIYNRREFFKQFRGEFSSAKRHNESLTLFMIDIDNFKMVNDTYGHDVGDNVLVRVVKNIKSQLRENDLFARYGGEEFVGVLLKSKNNGTIKKLRKIVENVSQIEFNDFPDLKITISAGFSHFDETFENAEEMIKKADIALYNAKDRGKNQLFEG